MPNNDLHYTTPPKNFDSSHFQKLLEENSIDYAILNEYMQGDTEDKSVLENLMIKETERIRKQYGDVSVDSVKNNKKEYAMKILSTEKQNKEQIREIIKEIVREELGVPKSMIDDIRMKSGIEMHRMNMDMFLHNYKMSENLSEEEKAYVQQEQQVRHIQNLLIAGAGYRAFDAFESEKYKDKLHAIDPTLGDLYHKVMGVGLRDMIAVEETMLREENNTGSSQIIVNEEGKPQVEASGIFAPILAHEAIKGVVDYLSLTRWNGKKQDIKESILSVDSYDNEQWQMIVGPQLWRQFLFLTKEVVAQIEEEEGLLSNKRPEEYLYAIYMKLNQLPSKQYLQTMKMMSDGRDGNQALSYMKEMIRDIHSQYEGFVKQTEAKKQQLAVENLLKEAFSGGERGDSGKKWYKEYGRQAGAVLGEYFPKEMKEEKVQANIVKKITAYLDGGSDERMYTGQELANQIQETIGALSGELTKIRAIQILQSEKTKEGGSEVAGHIRLTLAEIEAKEKALTKDAEWQVVLGKKMENVVLRQGPSQWFMGHTQNTATINDYYRAYLSMDDLPPTELVKIGDFGVYDLYTDEHLTSEGMYMNHCVGGNTYKDAIKKGNTKIWSIRGDKPNLLQKNTKTWYTIEYDIAGKRIVQWKGYGNKDIGVILQQLGENHKEEMISLVKWLAQEYEIESIADWNAILPEGMVLWNDGSIAPAVEDNKKLIDMYLQDKKVLVGEKPVLKLDSSYTEEQVEKLCSMSGVVVDMTEVKASIKAQLNTIQSSIVDKSNPVDTYGEVMMIRGDAKIPHMTEKEYQVIFPKLEKIHSKIWTESHVYMQPKKEIIGLEKHEYYERERKAEAMKFLKDNNMDTAENRAMIEAVKYTKEYISIGGVPWEHENLKASDVGMEYTRDSSDQSADYTKAHVFKGEGRYAEEDYFTYAAVEKMQKQGLWDRLRGGKKISLPTKADMEKTIRALPGGEDNTWNVGSAKLYAILTGCQQSGYRRVGSWSNRNKNGYLWSASPSTDYNARAFNWDNSRGRIYNYSRTNAFPVRALRTL